MIDLNKIREDINLLLFEKYNFGLDKLMIFNLIFQMLEIIFNNPILIICEVSDESFL